MKNLSFALYDEVADAFYYDMVNNIIEVTFSGYYSKVEGIRKKGPCKLIISEWMKAKSRPHQEDKKFLDLDYNMGIFSLILDMEMEGEDIKLVVNTVDGRYIDFIFFSPKVEIIEIKD